MSQLFKQHHGMISCESHQGDDRFSIEVFSGLRGFNADKPTITLRLDFPALRTTFSITPANARDLTARLLCAATAGDGKGVPASPPSETTNPHTGLYHEPEAL